MVVTPQAFYADGACTAVISADLVEAAYGSAGILTLGYEHRYGVAPSADAQGFYAFDMIVYGQTTYTSMKIEGNHLMIGSAFNLDTDDAAELAMSGTSPETRAYTIGKLPLYSSLYR